MNVGCDTAYELSIVLNVDGQTELLRTSAQQLGRDEHVDLQSKRLVSVVATYLKGRAAAEANERARRERRNPIASPL